METPMTPADAPSDPLAGPVLDVHTHAFPDELAGRAVAALEAGAVWFSCRATYDGTVGGLLASMDRAGIRRSVVASIATRPGQAAKIRAWSAAVASDRLVPLASVHPNDPDPEGAVTAAAEAGLRGIKLHPCFMACPADDPRMVRIARAAHDAGLVLLCHAGYDLSFERSDVASPERLRRLHEAVPGLALVAAHLGGWEDWNEARTHLVGRPVYLETSYTLGRCPPALLEAMLAEHPPQYLLFGTDAPWRDQAADLARLNALPIDDGLKRQMRWENGCRLLGLDAEA
jgi:hypothetical protein